ncbi:MAG: tetratricopeptide repeat protein, partial [Actinobacteria bacterium]|nr:tetratricopeptide repeat protein [Actinomycetota bacterium]
GGGKLNATSLLLEPLGPEESSRLIANLLGGSEIPEQVAARIAEAAEGNPLFVEEMLAMLIDEGLLARRDGGWEPTGDLTAIAVPPTIHALLAARLDRLSEGERTVLERAAVAGKEFSGAAVAELCPQPLRPAAGRHLMSLVRKELLAVRPGEQGGDGFRFRHLLIRDAAYEGLPKRSRAELHERFADWLELSSEARMREYEEIVAYHLEEAHRYRTELGPADQAAATLARRAAERLSSAGRRAVARGDTPAAAALLGRAVALMPEEDPARDALSPDLAAALLELGELDRAAEVLEGAGARAGASGDRVLAARLRIEQLYLDSRRNQATDAFVDELRGLIGLLEREGSERATARARLLLGVFLFWQGRAAEAVATLERAADLAGSAGEGQMESEAIVWLTVALEIGPTPAAEGLRYLEGLDERTAALRRGRAQVDLVAAYLLALGGEFDEARQRVERARVVLQDLGERLALLAWVPTHRYMIESLAGDLGAAEMAARECCEALEGMGEVAYLASRISNLAHAVQLQGRTGEAEALAERGRLLAQPNDVDAQILWREALARVRAARGSFDEAETLAREAIALADRTDYMDHRADLRADLGEVLSLAGQPDEAAAAFREALDLFEAKGNVVSAGRMRERLARPEAGRG